MCLSQRLSVLAVPCIALRSRFKETLASVSGHSRWVPCEPGQGKRRISHQADCLCTNIDKLYFTESVIVIS